MTESVYTSFLSCHLKIARCSSEEEMVGQSLQAAVTPGARGKWYREANKKQIKVSPQKSKGLLCSLSKWHQ